MNILTDRKKQKKTKPIHILNKSSPFSFPYMLILLPIYPFSVFYLYQGFWGGLEVFESYENTSFHKHRFPFHPI